MEHSTVLFDNTSLFNIVFSACFSFSNTNQVYIKSFENVHFIHFWKFFFQLRNILFIQKLENAQILRNCNIKITNIVQRATQKWKILKLPNVYKGMQFIDTHCWYFMKFELSRIIIFYCYCPCKLYYLFKIWHIINRYRNTLNCLDDFIDFLQYLKIVLLWYVLSTSWKWASVTIIIYFDTISSEYIKKRQHHLHHATWIIWMLKFCRHFS